MMSRAVGDSIKIITRDECTYCHQAMKLLKSRDIPFEELHIGLDVTREYVLESYPTQKLLPVVLVNDELVGGYTELVEYLRRPLIDDAELRTFLLRKMSETRVDIVFEKTNGELRAMKATRSGHVVDDEEALASDACAVWDIDKEAWRSFRWDNLISYRISDESPL